MLEIYNNTIVYVLCPAYSRTGGPELLHQLVCKLNKFGIKSFITYYGINDNKNYTPDDFKKYVSNYKLSSEIIDDNANIIVFPEIHIKDVNKYKKSRTVMWWMSVDNYIKNYVFLQSIKQYGLFVTLKKLVKCDFVQSRLRKFDLHMCQSYYAIDYLKKRGINNYAYLSDYINNAFFEKSDLKRKDNVLYNPKKGIAFTKKIISNSSDLNWIPIQNMTTKEVSDLLKSSKVYIDFGNHPGKDRFPREACMSGCCVITGKRGSANFYEDVKISPEFKFDDIDKNIPLIIDKINECISNYSNEIKKFEEYRNMIKNEENKFEKDILTIFKKQ